MRTPLFNKIAQLATGMPAVPAMPAMTEPPRRP